MRVRVRVRGGLGSRPSPNSIALTKASTLPCASRYSRISPACDVQPTYRPTACIRMGVVPTHRLAQRVEEGEGVA